MTTGMITKQWVAIHRKHHKLTDQPGDPHSPLIYGIKNILFRGVYYYYIEGKNNGMIVSYGKGTPNDWLEKKIYFKHNFLGIILMLVINLLLFSYWGFLIWIMQMIWIPFHAAGIINGIGHWWGYRNGNTKDNSRNIMPWGIWIGGEELHNNHHLDPGSVKLSRMKWEFDIGYMYLRCLIFLRLAKINRPSTV